MVSGTFWEHFAELEDPRCDRGLRHSAEALVTMAVVGVLCGADDWSDIIDIAEAKRDWLETFLDLPHGVPSHDTFGRFFAAINPEPFAAGLASWMIQALPQAGVGQIAIDGKTLRRSYDVQDGQSALHLVSAWCCEQGLVLGQVAAEQHSNEITAIPRLLNLLALKGTVVSIDAMGTQRPIAQQIVDAEGDYVLALKGNQGTVERDVRLFFQDAFREDACGQDAFNRPIRPLSHTQAKTLGKRHGRIERRIAYCIDVRRGEAGDWLLEHDWPGLASVVCVRAERTIGGKTGREDRFFLSSLDAQNPTRLLSAIRGHWAIENSLHWSLDMCFGEDQSRVRSGNAAENLAAIRRLALSLLKQEESFPASLKRKRRRCLLQQDYLLAVLKSPI